MKKSHSWIPGLMGLVLMLGSAVADELPEFIIEPGKRVGEITRKSTLQQLKKAYGDKNVINKELEGAEGETYQAAVLFEGTAKELHVIWNDEKVGQEVDLVEIIGQQITVEKTLKIGGSIGDVEKANGGPFKVIGFGWDLGGHANFEGGKLAARLLVRFIPGVEEQPDAVLGDVELRSDDNLVRQIRPQISQMSVLFD